MSEDISKEAASSKLIESSPQSILVGVKRSSSNDYSSSKVSKVHSNVTATSVESAGGQTSAPRAPPRKLRKAKPAQDEPCTPIFNPFTGELHKLLQRHSFEISNADLMSLGCQQFLNDQIIDYWLTEIWSNLPEHIQQRTHVFSTYFYSRLTTPLKKTSYSFENDASLSGAQKKHRRVMKWTKNVDLFSKDYVIIPINEDSHWFLAVICFPGLEKPQTFDGKDKHYDNLEISFFDKSDPASKRKGKVVITRNLDDPMFKASATKVYTLSEIPKANFPPLKAPCILVFDSLRNENNHAKVYLHLRMYLEREYLEKKGVERKFDKITIAGFQPTVPQQPNHCDCGIYVLKYVEMLLANSLPTFALPIPKMEGWFPESAITTKRKEIFESIVEHIKLEAPEKEIYIPQVKFQKQSAPPKAEITESKLLEGKNSLEADNEEEEQLLDLDVEDEDDDETKAETTEDSAGSGEEDPFHIIDPSLASKFQQQDPSAIFVSGEQNAMFHDSQQQIIKGADGQHLIDYMTIDGSLVPVYAAGTMTDASIFSTPTVSYFLEVSEQTGDEPQYKKKRRFIVDPNKTYSTADSIASTINDVVNDSRQYAYEQFVFGIPDWYMNS